MTAEQLEDLLGKVTQGEWRVGYRSMDVGVVNAKIGGYAKLFDVRGWGYLTGKGHGALGLSDDIAVKQQDANATLISLAPSLARRVLAAEKLVEALEQCMGEMTGNMDGDLREDRDGRDMAREALTAYHEASK